MFRAFQALQVLVGLGLRGQQLRVACLFIQVSIDSIGLLLSLSCLGHTTRLRVCNGGLAAVGLLQGLGFVVKGLSFRV